jgi:hypothetical protein
VPGQGRKRAFSGESDRLGLHNRLYRRHSLLHRQGWGGDRHWRRRGPGRFNYPSYAGLFEQATEDFKRCLDSAHYGHFLSCVSNGVASVEAYLNQEVKVYNKRNPGKELIDNKHNKVSFDDKIDQWLPVMTGGKKLDKGNQRWEHFKRLRSIRDGNQAHVKVAVLGANYRQLGELLNLFRSGVAGMLLDLHILFNDRATPAIIIRYAHLPDVEYLTEEA